MLVNNALTFTLSILMSTASAIHLSCAADPNADCDPTKYCTYTANNGNCASPGWGSNDQVPVFNECVIDSGCNGKCVNGLCCNTDILPNGEADCPTMDEISTCCFVRSPGPGGVGAWAPVQGTRPSELSCGC
ncbi:hypothetical protein FBEOM_6577 [Fusarium beomiforme]|uniref:Uncharacterized protein n=1 Tax=Fusarium beomiforme TaxID=44412 RepID=A0A9P5AIQ5_9HYPO|nr:hypothetical protein FBEOM_6577 [Fusarium beomiforme]